MIKMQDDIEEVVALLAAIPEETSKRDLLIAANRTAQQGGYTAGEEYDAVRERIKSFEDFRANVYLDGGDEGYATKGYGHKL